MLGITISSNTFCHENLVKNRLHMLINSHLKKIHQSYLQKTIFYYAMKVPYLKHLGTRRL